MKSLQWSFNIDEEPEASWMFLIKGCQFGFQFLPKWISSYRVSFLVCRDFKSTKKKFKLSMVSSVTRLREHGSFTNCGKWCVRSSLILSWKTSVFLFLSTVNFRIKVSSTRTLFPSTPPSYLIRCFPRTWWLNTKGKTLGILNFFSAIRKIPHETKKKNWN